MRLGPFIATSCFSVAMLLPLAGWACGKSSPRSASRKSTDSALVREQQRRIAAFDSVVRSINTDSAYKLWHVMLTAPDIRKAQLDMMCEYVQLTRRFGAVASDMAIDRMRDTLWKHDDPSVVRQMDRRMVGESPGIGRDTCGRVVIRAPYWLRNWQVPKLPALPPSTDSTGTP